PGSSTCPASSDCSTSTSHLRRSWSERTWATSSTACSPATTTPSRSRSPSALATMRCVGCCWTPTASSTPPLSSPPPPPTSTVGPRDGEMGRLPLAPDPFLPAAALIPASAPYVDGRSEPSTDVEVMGGLINRRRWFLDDGGRPLVAGFHAVGDCHTATNPLYGR